jgi:hypothetical protein
MKGEAMKREYEKPQFRKAVFTLQSVTAQSKVTGTGFHESVPK